MPLPIELHASPGHARHVATEPRLVGRANPTRQDATWAKCTRSLRQFREPFAEGYHVWAVITDRGYDFVDALEGNGSRHGRTALAPGCCLAALRGVAQLA
jgi:hypothetical protein